MIQLTRLSLALVGLAIYFSPALADDAKKDQTKPPMATEQQEAYLGVMVRSLPEALASQMSVIVPEGAGVLVVCVSENSPAAKAGVKTDDILLNFGDQKITSPAELLRLVRGDKPGQEVKLSVIHQGKSESYKVTLGERKSLPAREQPQTFHMFPYRWRQLLRQDNTDREKQLWESFDAMKLTRLDNNRWRAEIDYRDGQGTVEHKTFEGTREDIRKDVQAQKDLPANERTHLLRVLSFPRSASDFHFPILHNFGAGSWDWEQR